MKPPPFRYQRATTVEEAVGALAEAGSEARLLAGGQSLIAMMNLRLLRPEVLVDINRISALDYVRRENGTLAIGALTRLGVVEAHAVIAEACPLVCDAVRLVAHRPVRNRGTVGGNLAHADPSSELPAVAIALEAELVAASPRGERRIAGADFFIGALTTALEPDEMLTEVRFPEQASGAGWSFQEVSARKGDFAMAGVAVVLGLRDGRCTGVRLACAGVEDRARRLPEAEGVLEGQAPDEAALREAAAAAVRAVDPAADFHADAEYRRDLLRVLVRRSLAEALGRCEAEG